MILARSGIPLLSWLILLGNLCGCVASNNSASDPWIGFNRSSYALSETVDRRLLRPAAKGYRWLLPDPVERSIGRVFANLRTLPSAANAFAQGKPLGGMTDLGRFVVNTTVGLGGLFDPAAQWGWLPQNEDFGQTLAVWGWQESRYVYVPLLGPSTVRDLPSTLVRGYVPRLLVGPGYPWVASGVDVISTRAQLLSTTDIRDATAIDGYSFTREGFLQRRRFLIHDGDLPVDDIFDGFEELEDAAVETP